MFWNKTEVNILKEIDTTDTWWCSSAVLFTVKNGRNTISEKFGPFDKDYECYGHLQLNGMPLIQGKFPECSTCKAMLATGYGIENIGCPELVEARDCMNSGFVSITDSAERIKPLLGLLCDGYYALADTICFPSDGGGNFFYEVPDELKYYDAACYGYYCSWDYNLIDHFPMFLYPTQSSSLINDERVEYYKEILQSDAEPPRALAYHYHGFMNTLLDGHHKACAAASLGKHVKCLTIIPCDGYLFDRNTLKRGTNLKEVNPVVETLAFAGLETEAENDLRYLDVHKELKGRPEITYQKFDLIGKKIHYGPSTYPTVRDIATLVDAENKYKGILPGFDPDCISRLVDEDTHDADRYLEAILHWLSSTDKEAAYKLSRSIVKKGVGRMRRDRMCAALKFLLTVRCEETEQLFADLYIALDNNKEYDEIIKIVDSYWKTT